MNTPQAAFDARALAIEPAAEAERICAALRHQVVQQLRRRGAVLGLSGGVDSSVVAALCARAFGPANVLGVLMPEQDSDPDSVRLGRLIASWLGIDVALEDITPILVGLGCYRRRDEFMRRLFPEYGAGWRSKIVLRRVGAGYNVFHLVVRGPHGEQKEARMPPEVYLGVVATTNMKQRTRKQLEYYHADRLQYAVIGTPNRLEYDQGFFVKNGDGAADAKPIAHLYKSQVYQLAAYLGVPKEIRERPPTTDTYSLSQTQEEFFFGIPLHTLDVCMYGLDHGIAAESVAAAVGLSATQVREVYRDITGRRRTTRYQHEPPLLVDASSALEKAPA
ncbi:MAG TPA: NAD(+) synthase [Burkholderiales bacterium]|nr:NAD(+) synthase [Burkholderiales bacterium]